MSQTDFEMQERIHKLAERIYAVEGHLPVIDRKTQPAQWGAWLTWRREHRQPTRFMKTRERFTVLIEWPPSSLEALEQQYAGKGRSKRTLET